MQVVHQKAKNSTSFGFVDAASFAGSSERKAFFGAALLVAHAADAMGSTLGALVTDPTWVGACGAGALAALGGADGTVAALGAGAQAVIARRRNGTRILSRIFTPKKYNP